MSKLNIDQQTIKELFSNKKSDFLIPDYQRPYAWGELECQTLWDDIFSFAFPDNDYTKFNSDEDEYFLGPIVTFKNEDAKLEIIDGQQRLTTLMLLLRAFYSKFGKMKDENSISTSEIISKCIWKTDEFGKPDMNRLKIDSEVSTDDDKEEFLAILRTGICDKTNKSRYAKTYQFFVEKIDEFLSEYPAYFAYLPARILNNCILLPIEAESQDTALRIFSTLNDRGKPLSDTDIFKAQMYKYYLNKGEKDLFVKRWQQLELMCEELFASQTGSPMDELFSRYMYYERAKMGIKNTTTEALRKFYEKNKYEILKKEETLTNLEKLASFWEKVEKQDDSIFSERVLKKLSTLRFAPNSMWTYMVSVYFIQNKNDEDKLSDEPFYNFLDRLIAFIWVYAIMRPGVNALRTPLYPAMIEIVNNIESTYSDYKFDKTVVKTTFDNYYFSNGRPITKSMLAWWAYVQPGQELLSNNMVFDIEHIYPKKRQENEKGFSESINLESLGNKSMLEKGVNIRAADYRFIDKKKYYTGYTTDKGVKKEGSKISELVSLASDKQDYLEADVLNRKAQIIDGFINFAEEKGLLI